MANPEHLEILKQGVKAWNKWREENPDVEPDLKDVNFSDAMLHGANLSEADLTRANLSRANLQGTNLQGAKLYTAGLGEANLRGANLSYADLSGTYLRSANLRGADLNHADLGPVDYKNTDLRKADLSEANFHGANLYRAKLFEADLSGVNFTEANLSEARLIGAELIGKDLSDLNFSGADFTEANLSYALLNGSNLSKAKLTRANLNGANLFGADLSRAFLRETILDKANLSEATFGTTFFTQTSLYEVKGLDSCKHKGNSTIDYPTLSRSGDLPLSFLQGIGIKEEHARTFLFGTGITIEFTEAGWGDLIPITHALKSVLGEGYEVIKGEDRIAVKLESPDLLNPTMDAIGAVFSALEAESSGEVSSLKVMAPGNEDEVVSLDDVTFMLSQLIQRYDRDHKPDKLVAETGKGILEGLPVFGPLIQRWIEWVHDRLQKPDENEERLQDIHARFRTGIAGLLGIRALPEKEQKQLPPAVDDSDGES